MGLVKLSTEECGINKKNFHGRGLDRPHFLKEWMVLVRRFTGMGMVLVKISVRVNGIGQNF